MKEVPTAESLKVELFQKIRKSEITKHLTPINEEETILVCEGIFLSLLSRAKDRLDDTSELRSMSGEYAKLKNELIQKCTNIVSGSIKNNEPLEPWYDINIGGKPMSLQFITIKRNKKLFTKIDLYIHDYLD